MNWLGLAFAILCSLALAGVGLSFLAIFHAASSVQAAESRAKANQAQLEAALETARRSLEGIAAELHEVQQQPQAAIVPFEPRSGLNLSKRSQALRMSRRGSAPDQIAEALGIPLQEVDLLLKVHRIVIGSI